MSVSLNEINEYKNYFRKNYGSKNPKWKYFLRCFLDYIGINQPVEYYNTSKRMRFEIDVLNIWKNYGLNVPDVISIDANSLYLSKIEGETLDGIIHREIFLRDELITHLFNDLNHRHTLAVNYNEPKLCHVDANLRNIMYSKDYKIFHIDFEMGREYESVDRWMEREVSKLLISLLQKQTNENRKKILDLFCNIYTYKDIVSNMSDRKLARKRLIQNKKYKLYNLAIEFKNRGY